MKFEENAKVISQKKIADGVFDMWIMTSNIAEKAVPGQVHFRVYQGCVKAASKTYKYL